MQDSIFTKIIKGEIPSHKIYEDDSVLAFLDIHPVQSGHTLVIPKKQVEFVWDLPDPDYVSLMAATKKVALRLREVICVQPGHPFWVAGTAASASTQCSADRLQPCRFGEKAARCVIAPIRKP